METQTQAKQANWVAPVLIVTLTVMTLLAVAGWAQVVFGGFAPGIMPFNQPGGMMGTGGMMGGGMMMNTANTPGAGNAPAGCAKLQNDPAAVKEMQADCAKKMGGDHDKIHQQMQQGTTNSKNKTL